MRGEQAEQVKGAIEHACISIRANDDDPPAANFTGANEKAILAQPRQFSGEGGNMR